MVSHRVPLKRLSHYSLLLRCYADCSQRQQYCQNAPTSRTTSTSAAREVATAMTSSLEFDGLVRTHPVVQKLDSFLHLLRIWELPLGADNLVQQLQGVLHSCCRHVVSNINWRVPIQPSGTDQLNLVAH